MIIGLVAAKFINNNVILLVNEYPQSRALRY